MIIGAEPGATELRVEPGATELGAVEPDPLGVVAPACPCVVALLDSSSGSLGST